MEEDVRGTIPSLDEVIRSALDEQVHSCYSPTTIVAQLETIYPAFDNIETVVQLRRLIRQHVQSYAFQNSKSGQLLSGSTRAEDWERAVVAGEQVFECAVGNEGGWQALRRACEASFAATRSEAGSQTPPNDFPLLSDVAAVQTTNVLCFDFDGMDSLSDGDCSAKLMGEGEHISVVDAERIITECMSHTAFTNSLEMTNFSERSNPEEAPHALAEELSPVLHSSEAFLRALQCLLDCRPDTVLQHPQWSCLICTLGKALQEAPLQACEVAGRYFTDAGGRQRMCLLRELLMAVDGVNPDVGLMCSDDCGVEVPSVPRVGLLPTLFSFLVQLPDDWNALLDDEVESVLHTLLVDTVVRHMDFFSQADPHASWIVRWFQRPSLSRAVVSIGRAEPQCLDGLCKAMPSQHAVLLVAHLLPTFAQGLAMKVNGVDSDIFFRLFHGLVSSLLSATELLDAQVEVILRCLRCCASELSEDARLSHYEHVVTALLTSEVGASRCEVEDNGSPITPTSLNPRLLKLAVCFALPHTSCSGGEPFRLREADVEQLDQHLSRTLERCCRTHDAMQAAHTFWLEVLPYYAVGLPRVINCVVQAAAIRNEQGIYSAEQLVALSASLEGWLHLSRLFQAEPDLPAKFDFEEVLRAIVRVGSSPHACAGEEQYNSATLALLTRWCTCTCTRDGLLTACTTACCKMLTQAGLITTAGHLHWPLLLPVELYCGATTWGTVDANTVECHSEFRLLVSYQTLRLLLLTMHVPLEHTQLPDFPTVPGSEGPDADGGVLMSVVEQVFSLWGDMPTASALSMAGEGVNYGEDSFLFLVCLAVLSVLINPYAERWLWRRTEGESGLSIMRRLRHLCEARCGVDPVYFLIRFLTSGKGRKRLYPILLDGVMADLRIESCCAVDSFVDGEAYPECVPDLSTDDEAAAHRLVTQLLHGVLTTPSEWVSVHGVVVLLMRSCPTSVSSLSRHTKSTLRKRTAQEWLSFANKDDRSAAIARRIEADETTYSILKASGVDVLFLASLCVGNWLQVLRGHVRSSGSSTCPCWRSITLFANEGLQRWEDAVTDSLNTFVRRTHEELLQEAARGEWVIPLCNPLPFPSPLFALLLVKPFTFLG